MKSVIPIALIASMLLVSACGREEDTPPRATLERALPPAATSGETPAKTIAEAPGVQMPAAESLTDPAITSRIAAALQADPAMKGADVSINTDKGVVVLSGTVNTHEQMGVASAHAQRQDGVLRVDNHLRPQYS